MAESEKHKNEQRIFEMLGRLEERTVLILEQTTKTNGRITRLEERVDSLERSRAAADGEQQKKYEYRKTPPLTERAKLKHLLLVEEAHRLLANVMQYPGENANPKQKAIEFFCNLLSEVRGYGQGILIVDQIPTKLASDCLKNTNLKIVHRTVVREDREAIGRAMNMSDEQIDHLSALKQGYAAVYAEGDNRPKLVKMALVETKPGHGRNETLAILRQRVAGLIPAERRIEQISPACLFCNTGCSHYLQIQKWFNEGKLNEADIETAINKINELIIKNKLDDSWLENIVRKITPKAMPFEVGLCLLGLILKHSDLSESYHRNAIANFIKWRYQSGKVCCEGEGSL